MSRDRIKCHELFLFLLFSKKYHATSRDTFSKNNNKNKNTSWHLIRSRDTFSKTTTIWDYLRRSIFSLFISFSMSSSFTLTLVGSGRYLVDSGQLSRHLMFSQHQTYEVGLRQIVIPNCFYTVSRRKTTWSIGMCRQTPGFVWLYQKPCWLTPSTFSP